MEFMRNKIMAIDERDRQVWELITTVPKLNMILAVIFALINVFIPGITFAGSPFLAFK